MRSMDLDPVIGPYVYEHNPGSFSLRFFIAHPTKEFSKFHIGEIFGA